MGTLESMKKAIYDYEQKNGKMPDIITVSKEIVQEITDFLPITTTVNRWRLCGVDLVVSDALSGKTFALENVQEVSGRPEKEAVYRWVNYCLLGGCHDSDGKMCPYHCRTHCQKALAADFGFYARDELLKEKKGAKK